MKRMVMLAALGALLALTLSACGGGDGGNSRTATATVGTDQVKAIAANMLDAYNSGDYQSFSRDWSLPVKLIVGEHAFAEFRDKNLPITGPYVAIISVQPEPGRQDANHVSYVVGAKFQHKDGVMLLITVSRGNGEVEGLELNPPTNW